jgi:hypothetical protein
MWQLLLLFREVEGVSSRLQHTGQVTLWSTVALWWYCVRCGENWCHRGHCTGIIVNSLPQCPSNGQSTFWTIIDDHLCTCRTLFDGSVAVWWPRKIFQLATVLMRNTKQTGQLPTKLTGKDDKQGTTKHTGQRPVQGRPERREGQPHQAQNQQKARKPPRPK